MGCKREKKQSFHCSKCNRTITRKGKDRLSAIRRHYRDAHGGIKRRRRRRRRK